MFSAGIETGLLVSLFSTENRGYKNEDFFSLKLNCQIGEIVENFPLIKNNLVSEKVSSGCAYV